METSSIATVVIGVDVGGTNTDAVILCKSPTDQNILASAKHHTTYDITTGVSLSIIKAIQKFFKDPNASKWISYDKLNIQHINVGTTHFVNALVERKNLTKLAVIRLCSQASRAVLPFSDVPDSLRECIIGRIYFVSGGFEFDGREISNVNQTEIENILDDCEAQGIKNFVLSGIFSTVYATQEELVKDIIVQHFQKRNENKITQEHTYPSITMSHKFGTIGLLERENTAILNECLKPLCKQTIKALILSMEDLNIHCPLYMTQNDGTIIDAESAQEKPVCMLLCGPTNSMRGAAFLSKKHEAIVVDIGGTTTDVGMLSKGFPRVASTEVKIAGIRTNFHMPDILSIGLGGGSYITVDEDTNHISVGPQSAGNNIQNEAWVFCETKDCNRKLTATDIAVSFGNCDIGFKENVENLDRVLIQSAIESIQKRLERAIGLMKLSNEPIDVVLVGGGAILVDSSKDIKGVRNVINVEFADVANAIGAALSQVSGTVDKIFSLEDFVENNTKEKTQDSKTSDVTTTSYNVDKETLVNARVKAINKAHMEAVLNCEKVGGDKKTFQIIKKLDTPLSHLPRNAIRIEIKVVGDLNFQSEMFMDSVPPHFEKLIQSSKKVSKLPTQQFDSKGEHFDTLSNVQKQEPRIDKHTGEWILSEWDVECIATGAGILGCGGGGNPYLGKLLAKNLLKEGHKICLTSFSKLLEKSNSSSDLIVPVAVMGAPLVAFEKLTNKETQDALWGFTSLIKDLRYNADENTWSNKELVEDTVHEHGCLNLKYFDNVMKTELQTNTLEGKNISALVAVEIGGLNSIEPLLISAKCNIPVLDADGMGRAFPELQMYAPFIYGVKPYPAAIADANGRVDVVLYADNPKSLENQFRKTVVEMGCVAGVIISSLSMEDASCALVHNSYSKSWLIGNAVLTSRLEKSDPVNAILEIENGIKVFAGKIQDVSVETTGGFNKGQATIEGMESFEQSTALIEFQNENLLAKVRSDQNTWKCIASVPDLITIVDKETGEPIPTELLKYGQCVVVLVLPSHPLLRTEQALKFVGPAAFGYNDVKYIPCNESRHISSLID